MESFYESRFYFLVYKKPKEALSTLKWRNKNLQWKKDIALEFVL
jgi:hypothetical protein